MYAIMYNDTILVFIHRSPNDSVSGEFRYAYFSHIFSLFIYLSIVCLSLSSILYKQSLNSSKKKTRNTMSVPQYQMFVLYNKCY